MMEFDSANIVQDPHDASTKNDPSEPVQLEKVLGGDRKLHSSTDAVEGKKVESGIDMEGSGDVNMEASISADDVMRAGGFGARDDISSFLPVASDSTDFEASLRDARDYEEPQKDICRPGLGWKDVKD
ncbi:hypothetical protein L6452_37284 [Arctium lappa]|uniref:Uncharacterized protein n=1 Tax=Arctium lappa TaxID=4217 RepID=A0ACB8Y2I4_ARCLA|nr:hypothetical protein L6452_37284 [Arctium lappa]